MPTTIPQVKAILEAAILSAAEPVSLERLAQLFSEEEGYTPQTLRPIMQSLMQDYQSRGIELREVASGYRFQVQSHVTPWLARWLEERPTRYSRALLETLALIAYRQPISRSEIEETRGVVVSSSIIRTLQEREWVKIVGHRDVPGRPALYATTKNFLDYFNLKSLAELPLLTEIQTDIALPEVEQLKLQFTEPVIDPDTSMEEPIADD